MFPQAPAPTWPMRQSVRSFTCNTSVCCRCNVKNYCLNYAFPCQSTSQYPRTIYEVGNETLYGKCTSWHTLTTEPCQEGSKNKGKSKTKVAQITHLHICFQIELCKHTYSYTRKCTILAAGRKGKRSSRCDSCSLSSLLDWKQKKTVKEGTEKWKLLKDTVEAMQKRNEDTCKLNTAL